MSSSGIQQGPAAGRAIMELILDGGDFQTLDLQRFSFERILMDQKAEEWGIVWINSCRGLISFTFSQTPTDRTKPLRSMIKCCSATTFARSEPPPPQGWNGSWFLSPCRSRGPCTQITEDSCRRRSPCYTPVTSGDPCYNQGTCYIRRSTFFLH